MTIPTTSTSTLGNVLNTVYVNGTPYNNQPPILDVQMVHQYGNHDMCYVRIEYPPSLASSTSNLSLWPDDTPVAVQWGRIPDVQTWYGYVLHKEANSTADSGSNAMQITYSLIGTSAVLNPAQMRKWEQVSPTYIAKTIAAENGLRAVVTPGGPVLNYEAQPGMSHHQFMNHIADKTGYRFWCSGGTLYMTQPDIILTGTGSGAVPQFNQDKVPNVLDTCRNFQFTKGKNLPGSVVANRAMFGLDKTSGQLFSAVAAPTASTNRVAMKTTFAAQDYASALQRMQGWAGLSQFWIGATAQLYGTTTIYPGKLVNLSGAALPDSGGGTWLVSRVNHHIAPSLNSRPNMDVFISEVTLLRNTENSNTVRLANTEPVSPEFVKMKLNNNGTWVATNQAPVTLI